MNFIENFSNKKGIKCLIVCVFSVIICGVIFYNTFLTHESKDLLITDSDTAGYFFSGFPQSIIHPFDYSRNFGYPFFIYIFINPIYDELLKSWNETEKYYYWGIRIKKMYENANINIRITIDIIICIQFLLYIFAFIFLYYGISNFIFGTSSLATYISIGFLFFLVLYFFPPYNPRIIMSEVLTTILAILFTSFLIFYHFYNRVIYLNLASFCGAFSYFVRPNMIILSAITLIIIVYYITKYKSLYKFLIGIFLSFLPLAYIVYLTYLSGHLSFGSLDQTTNQMFYSYYANESDSYNIKSSDAKLFHKIYLKEKNKSNILSNNDYISALNSKNYVYIVDIHTFGGKNIPSILEKTWEKFGSENPGFVSSGITRSALAHELKSSIVKNHLLEIMGVVGHGFLSGMGLTKIMEQDGTHNVPKIYTIQSLPPVYLMWLSLIAWFAALCICKEARFALLLLISIHVLSILAVCIGHGIFDRYIRATNDLYIIGLGLAWICLARKGWNFYQAKRR